MAEYAFVTIYRVEAPVERVWDAIFHSERWPSWWRGVERVEDVAGGDAAGVGAVRRYTWKSALPYRLVLDVRAIRIEPPHRLEGEATGALRGSGVWTLSQEGSLTTVRYDWRVRTTKAWMNLLAPVARPLFAWNHDVVMRWGGVGLARHLGAAVHQGPLPAAGIGAARRSG